MTTGVLLLGFGGPDSLDAVQPFMCNLMDREPSDELVAQVCKRYLAIGGVSPLPEIAANIPLLWVEGFDLLQHESIGVPLERVTMNCVLPPGQRHVFAPTRQSAPPRPATAEQNQLRDHVRVGPGGEETQRGALLLELLDAEARRRGTSPTPEQRCKALERLRRRHGLLSAEASYSTGAILDVGGGR